MDNSNNTELTHKELALPDLYLVDGSGFIFRAFHALPALTKKDGTPIGAVLGFINMLQKLLNDFHAAQVAVIFDASRANFRNDIYAAYKANRSETPPDLIPQFPMIRAATEAFNLPSLELEGYEADDLIATYARLANERGQKVTIVSSDKDLMQLVRDGVVMWDPIKNKCLAEPEVFEKFGVAPDKVVDVQALAGDSTDNVPGVPGIGVKTAAQLITEFGDLETLLQRAGEIKQNKRRELLLEHAEQARISKKLVVLNDHVPVPVPLNELNADKIDPQKLLAFLQLHNFRSVIARLNLSGDVAAQNDAAPAAAQKNIPGRSELIQTAEQLQQFVKAASAHGMVALHTIGHGESWTQNVPSQDEIAGFALAMPGHSAYVPLQHGRLDKNSDLLDQQTPPQQIAMADAMAIMKPLLEDKSVLKIGHNIKDGMQIWQRHTIQVAPSDDVMMLSYALDGTSRSHKIAELAQSVLDVTSKPLGELIGSGKKQLSFDQLPLEEAMHYAAEYADLILRLHADFKDRLPVERMASLYETIERPLPAIVANMERDGVRIDPDRLRQLDKEFTARAAELEQEIFKITGEAFNIGSPKQLGEMLFDKMKLQGMGKAGGQVGNKGASGAYSTNIHVLEELMAAGHVVAEHVLAWRQVTKLKTTYCDGLLASLHPVTQRVHTSYMLASTSTGRFSSTDPNLQNLPVRTEAGRKIRAAFMAEEGHVLLSADYSQIELRLAADMAGIALLQRAFQENRDIHTLTASEVLQVPIDKVTPELRRSAKAINFGIIYGISGFGLAQQLKVPASEAAQYIKKYMARFPELRDYMERTKDEARTHGYVKTLYGRKCFIDGAQDRNPARRAGAERQAINAPLQGTAADIMKRAMIHVDRALRAAGNPAKMLLQVHDELVFEVLENQAEETAALIKATMEKVAPEIKVPLAVDVDWAKNWN